jgi:HPt (histidine-containing phosphotransfer) domain-containing protein
MTLGERALESEVLRLFERQSELLLARMRDAAPDGVATLAHTLKGSARGIGAWGVAQAAAAVEAAAGGAQGDRVRCVAELAEAVQESRTAIAARLRAA